LIKIQISHLSAVLNHEIWPLGLETKAKTTLPPKFSSKQLHQRPGIVINFNPFSLAFRENLFKYFYTAWLMNKKTKDFSSDEKYNFHFDMRSSARKREKKTRKIIIKFIFSAPLFVIRGVPGVRIHNFRDTEKDSGRNNKSVTISEYFSVMWVRYFSFFYFISFIFLSC
jgi:hypothetical protein